MRSARGPFAAHRQVEQVSDLVEAALDRDPAHLVEVVEVAEHRTQRDPGLLGDGGDRRVQLTVAKQLQGARRPRPRDYARGVRYRRPSSSDEVALVNAPPA